VKALFLSDAGCHTGFGRVTHSIGERLVEDFGWDISVLGVNYRGDFWPSLRDPSKPTPLKLYRPNMLVGNDSYGRSRYIEMLGTVEPDVVFILQDANVILSMLHENPYDAKKILLQYRPIVTYVPIDGYNLPPIWSEGLAEASLVVAMSKFGQGQLKDSHLVPHGVDTITYHPVSPKEPITLSNGNKVSTKRECKKAFGYDPDGFLVLRVDKNSARKDFGATVHALWPAMERHADIQVHFQCEDRVQTGVWITSMLSRREDLHKRFFLPANMNSFQGWPESDLAALYNAADIFVSTSGGEGFGLTLAESLACGVPVIAQNCSAIPETVGPGGVLVEPLDREVTVPSGEELKLADISAFTQAIERLYKSAGARRSLGQAGREHVVAAFNWDEAATRFDEFLRKAAAGTDTSTEVKPNAA
jgi:glycosyltransferase involved in cell wall biosynthesis